MNPTATQGIYKESNDFVLVQIFMSLAPSHTFRLLLAFSLGRARVCKDGICKSFESIPANKGF